MKGQVSRERRYADWATAEMTERAARHTAHTVRIKHWGSAVTIASMTAAMAFPAYADGLTVTDDAIRSMLNSTIDIVFLIFSVGIAVMGAFQLIPAMGQQIWEPVMQGAMLMVQMTGARRMAAAPSWMPCWTRSSGSRMRRRGTVFRSMGCWMVPSISSTRLFQVGAVLFWIAIAYLILP